MLEQKTEDVSGVELIVGQQEALWSNSNSGFPGNGCFIRYNEDSIKTFLKSQFPSKIQEQTPAPRLIMKHAVNVYSTPSTATKINVRETLVMYTENRKCLKII